MVVYRRSVIMSIFTLLLVLLTNILSVQYTDASWQWQNPLPQGNLLNDVTVADDTNAGQLDRQELFYFSMEQLGQLRIAG